MDAIVERPATDPHVLNGSSPDTENRPSRAEAEAAVRTLIEWAGDNPNREGLLDTPKRVVKAFEEYFVGYQQSATEILERTFEEVEGYDDMVVLRGIPFESHCEHHMATIMGHAHVGYVPDGRVVGLSKLARLVDMYAKRLQTQETMTAQIANALEDILGARGVAVVVEAEHQCMSCRGVHKSDVLTHTSQFRGDFKADRGLEERFWRLIRG